VTPRDWSRYRGGVKPTIDLRTARGEDFEPHVGSAFRIVESAAVLALERVGRYPSRPSAPRAEPFTLVFTGPPGIGQGMASLDHSTLGRLDLFVVPVGPGPDRVHRYEAVFN
jgi:hypothetical protein